MVERRGHLFVRAAVGLGEIHLGRVGEDHAEAEGGLQTVALEHPYLSRGIGLLHEDREVQARGPAPDAGDLHAPCSAALISRPAMMRCWISVVPSYTRSTRTERYKRSTGCDANRARPPRIWTAPSTIR